MRETKHHRKPAVAPRSGSGAMPSHARPRGLILASSSPRRRDLLSLAGLPFSVVRPDVDERRLRGETPRGYLARVTRGKLAAVSSTADVVLAADTIVVLKGRILGKPRDARDAARTLAALSGQTHLVYTCVGVAWGGRRRFTTVKTQVTFRALSRSEIAWYVKTGEPLDKAGSYAIQGAGGAFISGIDGSPTNVVGLPVPEALRLLESLGLELPWR